MCDLNLYFGIDRKMKSSQ